MSEESKEGNIAGTVNAVTGLVKAVPVYEDAIQPVAKEIGKALETIVKTVNVALAPLEGIVWGYDQIKDFVHSKLSEKLRNTPKGEIYSPKLNVAGPALEALKYVGHEPTLREFYANLLASSMDSATAETAHPGFVEILKQITPDEAKLLQLFSRPMSSSLSELLSELKDGNSGCYVHENCSTLGEEADCEHSHLIPSYLDNLCRLGIMEISAVFNYADSNSLMDWLDSNNGVTGAMRMKERLNLYHSQEAITKRNKAKITPLGELFINACVVDHASKRTTSPDNQGDLDK